MARPEKDKTVKPPKKKMSPQKKRKLYIWGGVTVFVLLLSTMFMSPRGSLQYGICKTFVELSEPYPLEVRPLSVDDFVPIGGPVKINYKKIDPFGIESVNTIECTFKRDAAGQATTELLKVDINGKSRPYIAESPEYIARFNKGLSAFGSYRPDLILPDSTLDNISEYKDSD